MVFAEPLKSGRAADRDGDIVELITAATKEGKVSFYTAA